MARINPKNLTVDFSNLRKLSMSDRIAMLKSERGRDYLSSLTPVEYAMLFPDYFRRSLPDLGKTATPTKLGFFGQMGRAITGGPSYGGAAPSAPARPGTAAPSAPPSTKASTPAASAGTKFGWEQKLAELSGGAKTQKSNIGGFELGDTTSVGPASINSKGYVNKEEFYKQAVKTFRNSPLNGFVPKDGEKYGIKNGTAEEWANLAMRTASVESSFRVTTTNPNDPGGSFGLFQFGYHYGITKENWKNPQAQLDAFVKYSSSWVKNGGGYILPPSDIKGVKRYSGHGGFGAAFSTFRNNKVNSESAWSVSNNIQGNIGRAQQQAQSQQATVKGPREGLLDKNDSKEIIKRAKEGDKSISDKILDKALSMEGLNEFEDRQRIKEYLKNGGQGLDPVELPWCADFVNATLAQAGIKGTGSAKAHSFREWGSRVENFSEVKKGDIVHYAHSHVDIATGNTRINPRTGKLEIETIGGNVGDSVKKRWKAVTSGMQLRRSNEDLGAKTQDELEKIVEKPQGIPANIDEVFQKLPQERRDDIYEKLNRLSPEERSKFFSENEKAILNTFNSTEKREASNDIVSAIRESAPGEIPNFKIWQEGEKAGTVPTSIERKRVFREGGIVVNLDTNWSKRGNQTGPLVVIPDNATDEQRKQAENYVREVERVYKEKFGKSLPGRVLTRSENGRGRTATMHTEPFSVNDDKAVDYFFKDPEGSKILAQIEAKTLGKIPGVQFSEPHNRYAKKKDVGAVSDRDPNISEVNIADQRLRLLQSMRDAAQRTTQSQPQQTAPATPPAQQQNSADTQSQPQQTAPATPPAQQQNPAGTQSQQATVTPTRPPPTSSYRLTGAASYLPQNTIRQYLPPGATLNKDGTTITIPSDSLDTYLKDPKTQESLQNSGITSDQLKGYLEPVQAAPAAPAEEPKKLYAGGTIRGLSTGGTERMELGPGSGSVAGDNVIGNPGNEFEVIKESTSGVAPTPSGDTQPLIGPDGNPIAMINPKSESVVTEPATGQTTIVPVQREAHKIIEPKQNQERNDYAKEEAAQQMADLENSIMQKMREDLQNQEPLPTNNPQLAEMHHSYTENAFSFSNSFIRALGVVYAKNIRDKDPKNLAFGRTDIA